MKKKTIIKKGYTFDDVLLVPQKSKILPNETILNTRLTNEIELNIPVISAAMDTVTGEDMAIAMAREGGVGVIHKNCTIDLQRSMVDKVKRSESGMILKPLTIGPSYTINEAKKILAFEVTKITRGEKQAKEAEEISTNIFLDNKIDNRINSFEIESNKIKDSSFSIIDAIEKLKLVKSRSEVKRLIKSKGKKIENENYNSSDFSLSKYYSKDEIKISVGKKNFGIIKISKK